MATLTELWTSFLAFDGPAHALYGAILVIVILAAARFTRWMVRRARDRQARGGTTETTSVHLLFASQRPAEQAAVVIGLYLFSQRLPIVDAAHSVANGVLFVLGTFCLARVGVAVLKELVDGYARSITRRHGDNAVDVGIFQLLKKAGALVVWLVALMVALHRFNLDIMSLATALGIGSLAVGFAARDTLGNMISGFTLLIDRPFREGDRVRLATLEVGDVRDIGLRSTRIQLLDSSYLIVPNNELVNQRVVNLTYPSPRLRGAVAVTLAYGSDVARAKELLVALARANTEVVSEPPPSVDVLALAESGLSLELGFFVLNHRRAGVVAEVLRVAAEAALRQNGFNLAYPTRTLQVQMTSPPGADPLAKH